MPRSKTPIALVIILLLFVTVVVSPVWADQGDAATAISSAENMILNGYNAAKEAETYGANITILVGTLNEAGSLLSQAELAYTTGDFDAALNFARQSQSVLNNFISETNTLKETAKQQRIQDFLINVIGPIIGSLLVMRGGLAVWHFLKKKQETTEAHVSESPRI